jgi:hypothetical protein
MNCEKAKKNIPLLAGNDLPERKAQHLREHLEECEACQKELKEYEVAFASLKSFARDEERDWREAEWKSLMKKVMAKKPSPTPLPLRFRLKMAWAYAFLFLLVLGLGALFFRNIFKNPAPFVVSENILVTQAEPHRTFKPEEAAAPGRLKDVPFLIKAKRLERSGTEPALQAALTEGKTSQDLLAMALVSKETGLKVYWYFNKNFEWKEK